MECQGAECKLGCEVMPAGKWGRHGAGVPVMEPERSVVKRSGTVTSGAQLRGGAVVAILTFSIIPDIASTAPDCSRTSFKIYSFLIMQFVTFIMSLGNFF